MSTAQPPSTLSQLVLDGHDEPMAFLVQVLFEAHRLLDDATQDIVEWALDLYQDSLGMIISQLKMEPDQHGPSSLWVQQRLTMQEKLMKAAKSISQAGAHRTLFHFCERASPCTTNGELCSESLPVYEYNNAALMPDNGDYRFLDEREAHMQAFLITGIGKLMMLRQDPEVFEIVRQAYVACDHDAVMTQVQVDWTSPFELLRQWPIQDVFLMHPAPALQGESPEYVYWSELVLRAGNTRHVVKVLRSIIGSCYLTGDCVEFSQSHEVCEE